LQQECHAAALATWDACTASPADWAVLGAGGRCKVRFFVPLLLFSEGLRLYWLATCILSGTPSKVVAVLLWPSFVVFVNMLQQRWRSKSRTMLWCLNLLHCWRPTFQQFVARLIYAAVTHDEQPTNTAALLELSCMHRCRRTFQHMVAWLEQLMQLSLVLCLDAE
jgi:hypothetical protein